MFRTGVGWWSPVFCSGAGAIHPCFAPVRGEGHPCFEKVPISIHTTPTRVCRAEVVFLGGVGEISDVPRISQKRQKAHPQTQRSLSTKNDDFLTNRF